jgi:hypothetical protein
MSSNTSECRIVFLTGDYHQSLVWRKTAQEWLLATGAPITPGVTGTIAQTYRGERFDSVTAVSAEAATDPHWSVEIALRLDDPTGASRTIRDVLAAVALPHGARIL